MLTDDETCEGYLAPIIGLEITSGYGNKTVYGQIVVIILISVKGLKISSYGYILAPIDRLFVSNAKTVIGHTI